MANEYSAIWFDLFLGQYDEAQTTKEVAFLRHFLPLPRYRRVVDLCCGVGRHSKALSELSHEVTGVDASGTALSEAAARCSRCRFIQADMRDLDKLGQTFDAVICLWQSFGYFDDATNIKILQSVRKVLAPQGRLILDLYHPGYFAANPGTRSFVRNGLAVTESKSLIGKRLKVELRYAESGREDCFDWRLYDPEELTQLCREIGFAPVAACTDFDTDVKPTPQKPRVQLVFQLELNEPGFPSG
jgi:SAM-dependent methyltransferase